MFKRLSIFLGLFGVTIWLDHALTGLGVPAGTIPTLSEVGLSLWIFWGMRSWMQGAPSKALIIPLGLALGDLAYGLNHYIFRHAYTTSLGPSTYALPYLLSMFVTVLCLISVSRTVKGPNRVFLLSNFLGMAIFTLNAKLILFPSLFHKAQALPSLIAAFTVGFSFLESFIIAFAAVLLVLSGSLLVQTILFGLIVMDISDIAIRYQSVYADLVGMSFFENGWLLGLTIIALGASLAFGMTTAELEKNFDEFHEFFSIRGMTIGFVLVGLCSLWAAMSFYFNTLNVTTHVSATLMISLMVFGFAIVTANFVSKSLSKITFEITRGQTVLRQNFPKSLPEEIRTIVAYFQSLNKKISLERDHALGLSSMIAHNIKSPVSALKMARYSINQHINKGCACCETLREQTKLLEISSDAINEISDHLLEEKKRLIGLETVGSSLKKALAISQANHPGYKIIASSSTEAEITPVSGLTEVVTNLINNAVEASAPNQPILVKACLNGTNMEVCVADKGPGISSEVLSNIRAGKSVTTKKFGNGIGLSSALNWAKEKAYEINIDSSTSGENVGTKISIQIPASLWLDEVNAPSSQEKEQIWT